MSIQGLQPFRDFSGGTSQGGGQGITGVAPIQIAQPNLSGAFPRSTYTPAPESNELSAAEKYIPGFGEVFRSISLKTVGTSAIQSRASAVLANGKYVFALPGSSGGVTDAWEGILKHQLDINHKPCNFVELFPRLKEK